MKERKREHPKPKLLKENANAKVAPDRLAIERWEGEGGRALSREDSGYSGRV